MLLEADGGGQPVVLTVADISRHQGKIDWNAFGPSIDAVIVKTMGIAHTPPRARQWPRATTWQYTSKKRMPGVNENTVDVNQFFGRAVPGAQPTPGSSPPSSAVADMGEDRLRRLVRGPITEAGNSKRRGVRGIASWERYLDRLLDASQMNKGGSLKW